MDGSSTRIDAARLNPVMITPPAVTKRQSAPDAGHASFDSMFAAKLNETNSLTFSKHANQRLMARDITLSDSQLRRIEDGVAKAARKGIKDGLVMVDDVYLVVNTKNKAVITAMNNDNDGGDNVFTNIDGAVIV